MSLTIADKNYMKKALMGPLILRFDSLEKRITAIEGKSGTVLERMVRFERRMEVLDKRSSGIQGNLRNLTARITQLELVCGDVARQVAALDDNFIRLEGEMYALRADLEELYDGEGTHRKEIHILHQRLDRVESELLKVL